MRPLQACLPLLVLVCLWQLTWTLRLLPPDALPAPYTVINDIWSHCKTYRANVLATLGPAALGYVIGNSVAILGAILFVWQPRAEYVLRGVNLTLFAIPPITLGPLLVVAFGGMTPQILLASICVYFPTMVATVVGLNESDPRALEIVRIYGGGSLSAMRWVRLRSSLPAMLSGLRVAAPAAILGAILAEFGSGAPGLGSFLLASMSLGAPERLWGIGLLTTFVSACLYSLLSLVAIGVVDGTRSPTIAERIATPTAAPSSNSFHRTSLNLLAVLVPFLCWQMLPWLLGVSPVVAKTPFGLWHYLVTDPEAGDARAALWDAMTQSLPLALLGLAFGLTAAFLLALLATVRRGIIRMLMPGALLLQSMPLVALTPLIVLLCGRGIGATLAVSISVSFFPAFVTLAQGMQLAPRGALDLVQIYDAGSLQTLRLVTIPAATRYVFAAARLVAPTALLGVMTAEWLATGYGLGNLMNEARGTLDYGMIWSVAFVSVAVSAGFYQVVLVLERRVLKLMYG